MRYPFFPGDRPIIVAALTLLLVSIRLRAAPAAAPPAGGDSPAAAGSLCVSDFLPAGYVKDGSASYQAEIQKAIDAAAHDGGAIVFPPMVYRIDEAGLQVHSRMTFRMHGAVFQLDEHCDKDGQAFRGDEVTDVQFIGGEIAGRNDAWHDGVNIRGFHFTGQTGNLRIRDLRIHDLSSNGIGIFATAEHPAHDIWITDTTIENCCNRYGDYLSEHPGPEKGSVREDQGLITFYYANEFVVSGCRFEHSRSDGTHFYKCQHGQFVRNKVYTAHMGGYFLESCEGVLASDNLILSNGSRGVTIERGSKDCTLTGNVIVDSGREGLWAPSCTGLIITSNIFRTNGHKPNGPKPHQIWNANVTVSGDPSDPTKSPTADYLIANNIFYTAASQIAAIRVNADRATSGVVVKDNLLRGENRQVTIEGETAEGVTTAGNQ